MVSSVNTGKLYGRRRCGGRFFGRRVNCEYVPLLPAAAVRQILDDPRNVPYLLVWKRDQDRKIKEAVRVSRIPSQSHFGGMAAIEIKRTNRVSVHVRIFKRALPRNGGYYLLFSCPSCCCRCKGLYAWEAAGRYTSSAERSQWQCRKCAQLRFASEGGALLIRHRGWIARFHGPELRSERPEPWHPYIFSDPRDAVDAGLGDVSCVGDG